MSQELTVLGATGSVGQTTAKVVESLDGRITIDGLVAHRNAEQLWEMATALNARWIGLTDVEAGDRLVGRRHGSGPQIAVGMAEVLDALNHFRESRVLGAMSGFSGLVPTLTAVDQGRDVLLANKETLVAAGALVMERAARSGSQIIPVDSEHSAVFQCLAGGQPFRRIILTCSGGPFRTMSRDRLPSVTAKDALQHPTWNMGSKITIDSATLMNKGLEVIEAHWLFDADYSKIAVVVHPESIIHSMVEFEDGATMAQMGHPDMQVPIEVALAWPERWPIDVRPLDLAGMQLTFEAPDLVSFPALALAREIGMAGGLYPCAMNAANEVAVAAFLAGRLPFTAIVPLIREVLDEWAGDNRPMSLEAIEECDHWARQTASERISA